MSSLLRKNKSTSFRPAAPRRKPVAAPPSVAKTIAADADKQQSISDKAIEDASSSTRTSTSVPTTTDEAPRPSSTDKAVAALLQANGDTRPTVAATPPQSQPLSPLRSRKAQNEASVSTNAQHSVAETTPHGAIPAIATPVDTAAVDTASTTQPRSTRARTRSVVAETTNAAAKVTQPARATRPGRKAAGAQKPTTQILEESATPAVSTQVAEESQPTIPNGRIREASPELGEPVQPATAARKPRQRKAAKRNLDQTIGGDDIVQSIEETGPKPKRTRSASAVPRKSRSTSTADSDEPKRRRKRNETPEDAEDQEIDHATTKMSDLTRDLKIGKKFSKHEEIKQRDLERKVRAKARRENPELVDESEDERRPRQVREVEMEVPADPSNGPRMRLVDGQIVIDETSLVVDRHKIAAQNAGVMEIVEEDDFTRITTQATFMKREKNIAWDFEAEELFYTGLRMFGTDFEMISKMFPSRSRRQIKLKFNREERLYPDKINRTLIGEKVPINFDEYKTHTGLEYEDVSAINAEREAVAAEQRAEEEKVEAELAEQTRQKKAAIHGIGGSEKENEDGGSSKRKSKRSKRNMHSINGGGEEVEILGDI